jgi:hypothetical protein
MKTIRVLVVSVFAFTSALMLGADTYYWKGPSSYADYADPANWIKGTSPSGSAATEVPGAGDKLHYTIGYDTYQRFDFGGGDYSVLGVDYTNAGTLQYGHRYMGFKNGSFTFTEDVYARRVYADVEEGGSLTFGENCNVRFGWGGAENQIAVKSGGELNVRGSVSIGSLRIVNSEGGTVVFDPASLVLWEESGSNVYSSFDNSGDMSFPGGLHFTESAASVSEKRPYDFSDNSCEYNRHRYRNCKNKYQKWRYREHKHKGINHRYNARNYLYKIV